MPNTLGSAEVRIGGEVDAIPAGLLWATFAISIVLIVLRKPLTYLEVRKLRYLWGAPVDPHRAADRKPIASAYVVLGAIGAVVSLVLLVLKHTIG